MGCTEGVCQMLWSEGGDDFSRSTYQEAKGLDLGEALVL
jgi:hypothetical protein